MSDEPPGFRGYPKHKKKRLPESVGEAIAARTANAGGEGAKNAFTRVTQERDQARAEIARLTRERDEARDNFNFAVVRFDECIAQRDNAFKLEAEMRAQLAAAQAEVVELRRVLLALANYDHGIKDMELARAALSAPTCAEPLLEALAKAVDVMSPWVASQGGSRERAALEALRPWVAK